MESREPSRHSGFNGKDRNRRAVIQVVRVGDGALAGDPSALTDMIGGASRVGRQVCREGWSASS